MNARTACKLAAALAASLLVVALPVRAGIRVSLEEELRLLEQGIQPRLRIAGAEFRVAVFTYEDPDETGLGNDLASLVAGEILLRSRVSSIGVLRYEGSVLPEEQGRLGYFDKVERVAEAQQVTLAVWGVVRQVRERLVIDTYVQVPPGTIDGAFLWIVSLPEAMGGGDLLARLRPNRIPAQRLDLPLGAIEVLGQAARNLNELRSEPRIGAPIVATVPEGRVYWLDDRRDDWVHVRAGEGRVGWVPTSGHCEGDCRPLLDVGGFAGELLRFIATGRTPATAKSLSPDARAVRDQIAALQALNGGVAEEIQYGIDASLSNWIGPESAPDIQVPPGGAAFANILAISRVAVALKLALRGQESGDVQSEFQGLTIDRDLVRSVAFDLAKASMDDPRNEDVLHNLAVLFEYVGEAGRAQLARSLIDR